MARQCWKGLLFFLALFFVVIAVCPISNQLFVRPILAVFDSRYIAAGDYRPITFDRDKWISGKARYRVGMATHFVNEKGLIGMHRADVIEMLGKPDIDESGINGTQWLLGYVAKGLFDESLWLEVSIANNEIVSEAIVGISWNDPRRGNSDRQ